MGRRTKADYVKLIKASMLEPSKCQQCPEWTMYRFGGLLVWNHGFGACGWGPPNFSQGDQMWPVSHVRSSAPPSFCLKFKLSRLGVLRLLWLLQLGCCCCGGVHEVKHGNAGEGDDGTIGWTKEPVPHDMETIGIERPQIQPRGDPVGVWWAEGTSNEANHQGKLAQEHAKSLLAATRTLKVHQISI